MNYKDLKNGDVIVFTCYGDRIAIFNDIKKDDISGQLKFNTYVEFVDMNYIFFEKDEPGYSYLLEDMQFRLATEEEKYALYNAIGKYFTEDYDKDWYNHFTDSSYFDIQDFLFDVFCIKVVEYDDDLIYPDFINEIQIYIWKRLCKSMGYEDEYNDEFGIELVDKKEFIAKLKTWLKINTNWDMEYDEEGRNDNYGKIDELIKYLEE
jgi:hypothetical protein